MIELGRYQKIPREERLCEICQSGEVEDEYHFANSCKAYSNQRDNFYTTLRNKITIITDQAQLVDIMKSTEHGIILSLSKYIIIFLPSVLRKEIDTLKLGLLSINY
jgi:hypothetical protein